MAFLLLDPGGWVLTDKWYTGMLKGLRCIFVRFWYTDGWVIVTYLPNAPNLQNWVYFGKWYRDGSQNHAFRGIEMVEILNSTLSIPVRFFFEEPPPPGLDQGYNSKKSCIIIERKHRNLVAMF